jgi:hypothetical protein
MTALFVVGSAPCLFEDLEAARKLYWDYEIMTVNGACTAVEDAQHCLSGHTNKAEVFAATRRKAFPNAKPWRLHANWALPKHRAGQYPRDEYPSVTDWWPGSMSTGATSAAKAVRIGLAMGFAPVILCGCPLDGSGYSPAEAQIAHDCTRVGHAGSQRAPIVESYKRKFAALAAGEFKGKVFSMSGFTRALLGGPPDEDLVPRRP